MYMFEKKNHYHFMEDATGFVILLHNAQIFGCFRFDLSLQICP